MQCRAYTTRKWHRCLNRRAAFMGDYCYAHTHKTPEYLLAHPKIIASNPPVLRAAKHLQRQGKTDYQFLALTADGRTRWLNPVTSEFVYLDL